MLKQICYVSEEINLKVSENWKKNLTKKGIQFLSVSITQIDENWDKYGTLFLCEYIEEADRLKGYEYFVIISCTDNNQNKKFDCSFTFAVENFDEIEPIYYIKMWQRFMKIPWYIVNTRRCRIREMKPDDINDLYEIYKDESITKYMEGLYEDREKELEYIKKYIENIYCYFGFGTWIIERKKDGRIIGRAGFNFRPEFERPELGFVIAKPYQKQGYAFEVCKKIINYAWQELEFTSIQALTDPENSASIHLLKKLGFIMEKSYTIHSNKYFCFIKLK